MLISGMINLLKLPFSGLSQRGLVTCLLADWFFMGKLHSFVLWLHGDSEPPLQQKLSTSLI